MDPTSFTLAEQYDAKINALYIEIRNLRASRNLQCSATRKIPVEVLTMVFRWVSTDPGPDDTRFERVPLCTYVSHVCRSWRSAALADPTLWNNTAGLTKPWLELSLHRAGAVPMKVVYPWERPLRRCDSESSLVSSPSTSSSTFSADAALEGILSVPERLRELELRSSQNINQLLKPTPFLSVLMLRGFFSVPLNFLGNDAPHLQSFTSLGCTFPSEATWLRNLQTLVLSQHWGIKDTSDRNIPINTSSFLGLLRGLDKLEDLTVDFDPIREAARREYTGEFICLPSLRTARFVFKRFSIHLANLFSHIEMPSIHNLTVEWPHITYDFKDAYRAFSSFVIRCHLPFRRMVWDTTGFYIDLTSGPGGPTCSVKGYRFSLGELPFSGLDTIEELHIRGTRALPDLLRSTGHPMPYPSLKQLSFNSNQLRPRSKTGIPGRHNPRYMIQLLRQWLKIRKRSYQLEMLTIAWDQFVTPQDIKSLEKFVPVTWIRNPHETPDIVESWD